MKASASYRNILQVALPILIGMIAQNILLLTNTAFLGHTADAETGLSVSAMGGLFYVLVSMLSFGFANGAQVLIARRAGEGANKTIGNIFFHNLIIMSFYAALAFVACFLFAPDILRWIIPDEKVYLLSTSYIKHRSYGLLFTILITCFNSFYTGVGRTKVILFSTITASIVNVVLDYTLIFGHFGFKAMGTDGAAIASVFADFSSLLVLFINAVATSDYRHKMNLFKPFKIQWNIIVSLMRLSAPLVIQFGISFGAWYMFFAVLGARGGTDLAISNVLRSILFLGTISCWAIASTANSLVSNLIGQGKQEEVFALIRKAATLSFTITIIFVGIILLFPKTIMQVYTSDPAIINGSVGPIISMCIGMCILAVATVLFQSVQGTGSTRFNLAAEAFAVGIYCFYLFGGIKKYNLSLTYAWCAEIVYWVSLGSVCLWYLLSKRWLTHAQKIALR